MNKDFHYEGTYAAAVLAGFAPEDASVIAWSAQAVDDCTCENLNTYYPVYNKWLPVYTCETVKKNIEEELSSVLSDETSPTLQKIRSIWIPFHFLPGNLDQNARYEGRALMKEERDIRDFLCMCEPASQLAADMINKSVRAFCSLDAAEQKLYLIKLGILMHVLADTWSHQYFTGTPNYLINEVSNLSVIKPASLPADFSTQTSPAGATNYSISYLGHGRAGHYPDYGCMSFDYTPVWKETSSDNLIHRVNVDDFQKAFSEMYYALYCHRHAGNFSNTAALSLNEEWTICIKNIVSAEKSSQSHEWRQQLADFADYTLLPEYTFQNHPRHMNLFQSYAREHQSYVMGYLQRIGNVLNI